MRRVGIIILISIALYLPSISVFFSADDWFHLRVSKIENLGEFLNFFSFIKNEQSISFYRPIPTQLFFFVFQGLFGLKPAPSHIFVLFVFGYSIYLLYLLARHFFRDRQKALISTFIYGVASSNITRIYFLSHFQEVMLVVFSLLTILSFLKEDKWKTTLFFLLALMSKETAVVLPIILILISRTKVAKSVNRLLLPLLIAGVYLFLRLYFFGGAVGDSYIWDFSPIRATNTLVWYGLWTVGAPELLIDYIGSGLRPIPRFFTDFPVWWHLMIWPLLANIIIFSILLVRKIKNIDLKMTVFIGSFFTSLLPVIFLPHHKFAVTTGLPIVWFSLLLAYILPENKKVIMLYIALFLSLNLPMNILNAERHHSVGRGKIAEKVYRYISENYPNKPTDSYFEFINDSIAYTPEWGSSRQIFNSIGGSELFRVIYNDRYYEVYFEDFPGPRPEGRQKITISSKMFLK